MYDTSITIRMNSKTKARAQTLFNSLGLDMSTAVNIFISEAIEFQGIPFVIRRYNGDEERSFINERDEETAPSAAAGDCAEEA